MTSNISRQEAVGMCLMKRLSSELPVLWDIRGTEGEIREIPCALVGGQVCGYSCTVEFGKENTIVKILDDSGTGNCI